MFKNHIRISFAGIAGLVLLTAALFIVGISALTVSAYCFGVLGGLVSFGSLVVLSRESRSHYIANAAISLITFRYLAASLSASILLIILDKTGKWSIPSGYFILLQLFFAVVLIWHLLAMGSGKDEIERVGISVKESTSEWYSLKQKIVEIQSNSGEATKKDIDAVSEALRYAEPMSNENLKDLEAEIRMAINELATAVKNGKDEDTGRLCYDILKLVKNRNEQCKLLK